MNSYADFSGFLENFKYLNKSNFFKANFEKFDQHYPSRGAGEVPFSYLLDPNKRTNKQTLKQSNKQTKTDKPN